MNYAVIMAGGSGTRFWPLSRQAQPKQFLSIMENKTMIQATVERLLPLFGHEHILIVGNKAHENLLKIQLPELGHDQFLLEPYGRNTATAIGLAAQFLLTKDADANMFVVPSDHLIGKKDQFLSVVKTGLALSLEDRALITLGIKPTRPETGYGYIQADEDNPIDAYPNAYHVKTFAEKPNLETAKRFVAAGDFLWNSGMFIWRADVIMDEIKNLMPDLHIELMTLENDFGRPDFDEALDLVYARVPNLSIDYGVMEKAKLVYVIKSDFGWSDVGSWDEVGNMVNKDGKNNHLNGNVWVSDVENSFVKGHEKLIALVGVKNLIVVETEDSILICEKGSSQHVKSIVEQLKRKEMADYL